MRNVLFTDERRFSFDFLQIDVGVYIHTNITLDAVSRSMIGMVGTVLWFAEQ